MAPNHTQLKVDLQRAASLRLANAGTHLESERQRLANAKLRVEILRQSVAEAAGDYALARYEAARVASKRCA